MPGLVALFFAASVVPYFWHDYTTNAAICQLVKVAACRRDGEGGIWALDGGQALFFVGLYSLSRPMASRNLDLGLSMRTSP